MTNPSRPDPSPQSVRAAARGDEAAFGAILDLLRGDLVAAVRTSRVHPNDYEDAVQEATLVVWRCTRAYRPEEGTFRAYALTSVWRKLKEYGTPSWGREIPLGEADDGITAPANGRDEDLEPGDGRGHTWADRPTDDEVVAVRVEVHDALELLTPEQRALLREHFGVGSPTSEGRSVNQLAALHRLSTRAVSESLQSSVDTLRRRMV